MGQSRAAAPIASLAVLASLLSACASVASSVPASPPASSSGAPASAATPAPAGENARPPATTEPAGGGKDAAAAADVPANPSSDAGETRTPPPAGTTFILPGADPSGAPAPPTGDGSRPPPVQGGSPGSVPAPASPGGSSLGLTLSVVVRQAAAHVGETLSVEIGAASGAAVVDAPLHVQYDPERLLFLDASEGDFMKRDGAATVFLVNSRSRPGDVLIGIGRTNRARGVSGRGALCTVRFEVLAPGPSRIAVGPAMAWGADGALVPVTLDALEIETLP